MVGPRPGVLLTPPLSGSLNLLEPSGPLMGLLYLYPMSRLGASGQVCTDVPPNVWCHNTDHNNTNVRYFKHFTLITGIKRVSRLQSFEHFVISVFTVKIKSPEPKIFILWTWGLWPID
jgi:hypothetical protein